VSTPATPGSNLATAVMTAFLTGDDELAQQVIADCDDVATLRQACAFLGALAHGYAEALYGDEALDAHQHAIIHADPDAHP
jgi:hypothetical protein